MTAERTGFFEESHGVRSMTRLTMFLLTLESAALVVAVCWYLVHGTPEASVIAACGGILVTLVIHGSVALWKRGGSDAGADAEPTRSTGAGS